MQVCIAASIGGSAGVYGSVDTSLRIWGLKSYASKISEIAWGNGMMMSNAQRRCAALIASANPCMQSSNSSVGYVGIESVEVYVGGVPQVT